MPGSGTGTFIDPNDYQASLRQARIELLVTSRGAFNARLTWATLHHLQLIRGEENLPRIAYVSLDPTLVFVGFATKPYPSASGSPKCCSGEGGSLIEHIRNTPP